MKMETKLTSFQFFETTFNLKKTLSIIEKQSI